MLFEIAQSGLLRMKMGPVPRLLVEARTHPIRSFDRPSGAVFPSSISQPETPNVSAPQQTQLMQVTSTACTVSAPTSVNQTIEKGTRGNHYSLSGDCPTVKHFKSYDFLLAHYQIDYDSLSQFRLAFPPMFASSHVVRKTGAACARGDWTARPLDQFRSLN